MGFRERARLTAGLPREVGRELERLGKEGDPFALGAPAVARLRGELLCVFPSLSGAPDARTTQKVGVPSGARLAPSGRLGRQCGSYVAGRPRCRKTSPLVALLLPVAIGRSGRALFSLGGAGACFELGALQSKPADVKIDTLRPPGPVASLSP